MRRVWHNSDALIHGFILACSHVAARAFPWPLKALRLRRIFIAQARRYCRQSPIKYPRLTSAAINPH